MQTRICFFTCARFSGRSRKFMNSNRRRRVGKSKGEAHGTTERERAMGRAEEVPLSTRRGCSCFGHQANASVLAHVERSDSGSETGTSEAHPPRLYSMIS